MENNHYYIKNEIEALLFAWGDPIDTKELMNYFEITKSELDEIINSLENDYLDRGIRLQKMGNQIQLNTNPSYNLIIENFGINQKKRSLSAAALECLSILAYLEPTTKAVIEEIRGVKSDGPVQTLLEKGLIKEIGKLKQVGRPYVYKTTDFFLKSFELESIKALPELKDRETIKELLKFTEIKEEDIEYLDDTEDNDENKEIDEINDEILTDKEEENEIK